MAKGYITKDCSDILELYFGGINTITDIENQMAKLDLLLKRSKNGREAFLELKYFLRHLKTFNIIDKIKLDLSLVLNQSYYDGVIFQAVLESDSDRLDIIAAGGRYDKYWSFL